MTATLIEVQITLAPRPRRFKVQRRVDIYARDQSDRRFLFSHIWHTVAQADRQAVAEKVFQFRRREDRDHTYRIAEEWPIGSNLREIK